MVLLTACSLMASCMCIGALALEPQMHANDQGSQTTKDQTDTTVADISMTGVLAGANYNSLGQDDSKVSLDAANGQVLRFRNLNGDSDVNDPDVFAGDPEEGKDKDNDTDQDSDDDKDKGKGNHKDKDTDKDEGKDEKKENDSENVGNDEVGGVGGSETGGSETGSGGGSETGSSETGGGGGGGGEASACGAFTVATQCPTGRCEWDTERLTCFAAPSMEPPPTEAPTTEEPTTEAPTTEEPTTEAPTTEEPTTEAQHLIQVSSGSCTIDSDGCARSPNYPHLYGSNQACTLRAFGFFVDSVVFNTEDEYDKLTLNGKEYSGLTGPAVGSYVDGDMGWTSDSSMEMSGWKICPPYKAPTCPQEFHDAKILYCLGACNGLDNVNGCQQADADAFCALSKCCKGSKAISFEIRGATNGAGFSWNVPGFSCGVLGYGTDHGDFFGYKSVHTLPDMSTYGPGDSITNAMCTPCDGR